MAKKSHEIIANARFYNLPTYETGEPCKSGHLAPRFTKNHRCTQCKHNNWGYRNLANRKRDIVNRIKAQARHKNILVDETLSVEDIEWNEYCPILGVRLEYFSTGGKKQYSASIDRVVPSKGYVPGNVVAISNRANSIKSDIGLEQARNLVKYLEEHTSG